MMALPSQVIFVVMALLLLVLLVLLQVPLVGRMASLLTISVER